MAEGSRDGKSKESKQQQSKPAKEYQLTQEQVGPHVDAIGMAADPRQLSNWVVDNRLAPIQRQKAASRIGQLKGNAYLASFIQRQIISGQVSSSSQVQREDDPPVGRGQSTPFGTYWIVPDDVWESFPGVVGEQITESAFEILENVWNQLQARRGNLRVSDLDLDGHAHAGFRDNMMTQIGALMSQPTGRSIVVNLMSGTSDRVTIRPSRTARYGGGYATRTEEGAGLELAGGTAGRGSGTVVEIDANLTDDDVSVYDAAGNEISQPVFVLLGHELIHAVHNRAGRNRRELAASDASYTNREEEETIATGTTTENDIRAEHGLAARHGHGGVDTRPEVAEEWE